jgi:hypothetical protein
VNKVVPIRAPKRERIIIHCQSDEVAKVGRALMEVAERGIPAVGTVIVVNLAATGEPMFSIERQQEGPQTIKVWSYALSRAVGRIS